MAQRWVLAFACVAAALGLTSCPNAASPEELLRAGDTIRPTITISSHQEGDPFAEPSTTIRGIIADAARNDGTVGLVSTSSWAVEGATTGGDLTPGEDGSFSVEVDTNHRVIGLVVAFTATDWNGNAQTVRLSLAVPKEITSFAFETANNRHLPFDAVGAITGTAIQVLVASGTVRTSLVAAFTTTGTNVTVAGAEQHSGLAAQDFSDPVVYTVTGRDSRTKDYTVTVTEVTQDYGRAEAPTFGPVPNTYDHDIGVTLSTATPGGVIYYATDGGTPVATSTRYTAPIPVALHGTTATIRAATYAPGYTPSEVATGTFAVCYPQAEAPTFDPGAGSYFQEQHVTMATVTGGASIHYTTDGNDPSDLGDLYVGAVSIVSTTTIRAFARAPGKADSDVVSSTYVGLAPPSPLGLKVDVAANYSISLSWSAAIGANSYQIDRSLDPSGASPYRAYDGTATSCTDSGLSPGAAYYYRVKATGDFGSGDSSTLLAASTSQHGARDASFGTDGQVLTDLGSMLDRGYAVGVQADGKLVVAGSTTSSPDFLGILALLRYSADGSVDATFGTGGLVTEPLGPNSDYCYGNGVALQADGKILVVGSTGADYSSNDFVLLRYLSSGGLDTAFGNSGKATTPIGSGNDYGLAVALQSDAKILAAGVSFNGGYPDIAVVRYNTNGSLDTTFGSSGKVTTPIGSSDDWGYAITVQTDGKILVAGSASNGADWDVAVVRYNANGGLDSTFGSGGKVVTPVGSGHDAGRAITLQTDGKIVVVGSSNNGSDSDVAVVRYGTDGSLDTTFGSGGKVTSPIRNGNDYGFSAVMQSDGKILVAGSSNNGTYDEVALLRYGTNGILDPGFGSLGVAIAPAVPPALPPGANGARGYAIALQADGKIVVAGQRDQFNCDVVLIRFHP